MDLTWKFSSFDELDTKQLYNILALRTEVFVVEQNCPYQECDGLDEQSMHLCGHNKNGDLMAYMRVLPQGVVYNEIAMGRIVTSPKVRRSGLGKVLMEHGIEATYRHFSQQPVRISAQSHLVGFYESFGFKSTGKEYLEDDIPHTEMLKSN